MRKLTFRGYLMSQMQAFCGKKTTSLYELCRKSESEERLKETLCIYLSLYVDKKLREKLTVRFGFLCEVEKKLFGLNKENVDSFFEKTQYSEFRNIYENYLYQRDKKQSEDNIKIMMHKRICEIKNQKDVSNYRIYKSLNLNPGNTNAFLKNADVSKLSLQTTRSILEFLKNYKVA